MRPPYLPTRALALAATLVVVAGSALLFAPRAAAHDFWIEPERPTFSVASGVDVSLRVGDAFQGEPIARNPRLIERFAALGRSGEIDIVGVPGHHPAGRFEPDSSGAYWLLYRSLPSPVALDAEAFESYLAEEGLDHVIAARRERGEAAAQGRERFSRCAKALVTAIDPAKDRPADTGPGLDLTAATGLTLDLIPEADPRALGGGGELPLRLLYRGRPAAGVLLEAHGPDGAVLSARTDDSGRARFALTSGGWMIAGVHMVAAPPESGADWESLWASLRFSIPGS